MAADPDVDGRCVDYAVSARQFTIRVSRHVWSFFRLGAHWKDRLRLTSEITGVASRLRDAKDGPDVAYKAIGSVLRAARSQIYAVNEAYDHAKIDRTPIPFEIVRPVVVLGGTLLLCDFATDGSFTLTKTDAGTVLVSQTQASPRRTLIDVVSERGVAAYLTEQRAIADELLAQVTASLKSESVSWQGSTNEQIA